MKLPLFLIAKEFKHLFKGNSSWQKVKYSKNLYCSRRQGREEYTSTDCVKSPLVIIHAISNILSTSTFNPTQYSKNKNMDDLCVKQ
jgi:hypothetical protein